MSEHENEQFNDLVDRWIYHAVDHGAVNFNSLLQLLPGVFPDEALRSLCRLSVNGKIDASSLVKIDSSVEQRQHQLPVSYLPAQHPLDYDWRFTASAVDYLIDICQRQTESNESIAVLGVPSMLWRSGSRPLNRKLYVFDRNPLVADLVEDPTAGVSFHTCDIRFAEVPDVTAQFIVMDPPWYGNDIRSFLWFASSICDLGGNILTTLPPIGTRPGVQREIDDIVRWARGLGLSLIDREAGKLPYMSPLFEVNALKASGLEHVLTDWRRGDIAMFKKEGLQYVSRPRVEIEQGESWVEQNVGNVRIKIRGFEDSEEFASPRLLTLVPSHVLPSVSRRHEIRPSVDVWTAGNRVFGCQGLPIVHKILYALSEGHQPVEVVGNFLKRALTSAELNEIRVATKQATKIIELEKREISSYYGPTNNRLA
jgi:hypothetical protein